jgi:triacylglycerol lipase
MTRPYMINTFNPNTPNVSSVYYQSWAAKAKTSCPSVILEPTWLILLAYEGANDGLVSVNSAKWGNFRGVEDAAWYSVGCDHLNIVGQLFGITPGFDEDEFYIDIASDLKGRGY